MQKSCLLITVSSPRFRTALLFLRANLRSCVGDEITRQRFYDVTFHFLCFVVRIHLFIFTQIEIEKEEKVWKKICTEVMLITILVYTITYSSVLQFNITTI